MCNTGDMVRQKCRCIINPSLQCRYSTSSCAATDAAFLAILERWLLVGRTPRALTFCTTFSHNNDFHAAIIRLAEVAVCFSGQGDDGLPYDDEPIVLGYLATGRMTYRVCRALRRARAKWKRRAYSQRLSASVTDTRKPGITSAAMAKNGSAVAKDMARSRAKLAAALSASSSAARSGGS